MTKRQDDVFSAIIISLGFIILSGFNVLITLEICSLSEEELFANLTATFKIFEGFHSSVATFVAVFCLLCMWILWIVYLSCCITLLVRQLKEVKK